MSCTQIAFTIFLVPAVHGQRLSENGRRSPPSSVWLGGLRPEAPWREKDHPGEQNPHWMAPFSTNGLDRVECPILLHPFAGSGPPGRWPGPPGPDSCFNRFSVQNHGARPPVPASPRFLCAGQPQLLRSMSARVRLVATGQLISLRLQVRLISFFMRSTLPRFIPGHLKRPSGQNLSPSPAVCRRPAESRQWHGCPRLIRTARWCWGRWHHPDQGPRQQRRSWPVRSRRKRLF